MAYSATFSHPDYTVGSGMSPDLPSQLYDNSYRLAGLIRMHFIQNHTAGRELHPAPKVSVHSMPQT